MFQRQQGFWFFSVLLYFNDELMKLQGNSPLLQDVAADDSKCCQNWTWACSTAKVNRNSHSASQWGHIAMWAGAATSWSRVLRISDACICCLTCCLHEAGIAEPLSCRAGLAKGHLCSWRVLHSLADYSSSCCSCHCSKLMYTYA